MKQALLLLLCAALMLPLSGCGEEASYQYPITFYYQGTDLSYDAQCTAIAGETREGADYDTLEQILLDYLQGPVSENLATPFPAGLALVSVTLTEDTLHLTFSKHLAELSGLQLTVACCCIARTCLELTEAENICICAEGSLLYGEQSVTWNRDNMILIDTVTDITP